MDLYVVEMEVDNLKSTIGIFDSEENARKCMLKTIEKKYPHSRYEWNMSGKTRWWSGYSLEIFITKKKMNEYVV